MKLTAQIKLNPSPEQADALRRTLEAANKDGRVAKLYFTGMLTHGQSDFFVQYIDPESHSIRSYYPDFLLQAADGRFIIVEVKGDNQIDAPVVLAKQSYAQQLAGASGMSYRIIKGSDANAGNTELVLGPAEAAARQYGLGGM